MRIRIGIVEDHAATRQRLVEQLRFYDEVEVVLAVGSGEACLEAFASRPEASRPQVMLMDIQLPASNGIETTRRLKALVPDVEVLMFTVFEDDDRIFRSIQAGASGYLLKDDPVDEMVTAIRELTQGGAPMSASVARRVLSFVREGDAAPQADGTAAPFELSEREVEVLHHVVAGRTNREIGDLLFLSPLTVKTHIKNIYKKLHVHSRASVVQVALRHNLLR